MFGNNTIRNPNEHLPAFLLMLFVIPQIPNCLQWIVIRIEHFRIPVFSAVMGLAACFFSKMRDARFDQAVAAENIINSLLDFFGVRHAKNGIKIIVIEYTLLVVLQTVAKAFAHKLHRIFVFAITVVFRHRFFPFILLRHLFSKNRANNKKAGELTFPGITPIQFLII